MVTVTLVIYGVGLTLGNALGGHFADKALTPTLIFAALCSFRHRADRACTLRLRLA